MRIWITARVAGVENKDKYPTALEIYAFWERSRVPLFSCSLSRSGQLIRSGKPESLYALYETLPSEVVSV